VRILAIILTFVGVSIAATGLLASAASITLSGAKLGANTESVAACDTAAGVTVTWTTAYDSSLPGYKVTQVTVDDIDTACDNAVLRVTLANSSGTALTTLGPVTVDVGAGDDNEVLSVSDTVPAENVESAAILLTGP
jgi:hypothetical protein